MAYKRIRTRLTPTTYRTTIYKTDGSTHTSVTTKVANQTWTESERGRTHTVNTDGWITRKDYRKKKRKIPKFDFSFLFGKKKKKATPKSSPNKSPPEIPTLTHIPSLLEKLNIDTKYEMAPAKTLEEAREEDEYMKWLRSLPPDRMNEELLKLKTHYDALYPQQLKEKERQERIAIFTLALIFFPFYVAYKIFFG